MEEDPIVKSLKFICSYLNDNNIAYSIVGGISVIVWGRARTTEDIDIILDHTKLDVKNFVRYLTKNNFDVSETDFEGFKSKDHCTLFYKDGLFRIDIIGIYTEDNRITIKDSVQVEFYSIKMFIDSPESLIAHKLSFNSQQDIEDAYAILLRLRDKIDFVKLNNHASRLHVTERLQELLKKID